MGWQEGVGAPTGPTDPAELEAEQAAGLEAQATAWARATAQAEDDERKASMTGDEVMEDLLDSMQSRSRERREYELKTLRLAQLRAECTE
jgi:hypothetical protein